MSFGLGLGLGSNLCITVGMVRVRVRIRGRVRVSGRVSGDSFKPVYDNGQGKSVPSSGIR